MIIDHYARGFTTVIFSVIRFVFAVTKFKRVSEKAISIQNLLKIFIIINPLLIVYSTENSNDRK